MLVRDFSDRGMTMYYIFNPLDVKHDIEVSVNGKSAALFDPQTGEEKPVYFEETDSTLKINTTLQRRGSVVLFVYNDGRSASLIQSGSKSLRSLSDVLKGDWKLKKADNNCLTLDYCDLYFDGELAAENLPVSDVQEKACAFLRPVKTDVVFRFNVKDDGFEHCDLALETPEIFTVTVNGEEVPKNITGYLHDTAFKTIDIRRYIKNK